MSKNTRIKICYHITLHHPFFNLPSPGTCDLYCMGHKWWYFCCCGCKIESKRKEVQLFLSMYSVGHFKLLELLKPICLLGCVQFLLWTFILTTPSDQKVLLFTWLKALLLDLRFPVSFPIRSALTLRLVCYPLLSVLIIFCTFPTQPVACLNRL